MGLTFKGTKTANVIMGDVERYYFQDAAGAMFFVQVGLINLNGVLEKDYTVYHVFGSGGDIPITTAAAMKEFGMTRDFYTELIQETKKREEK
jgi:hypothetical protein